MIPESNKEPLVTYRVLVQGAKPEPFLRRFAVHCRGMHQILDLVAARMTEESVVHWGILAVDEAGPLDVAPDAEPSILFDEALEPFHKKRENVLQRPWGCFVSDTEALDTQAYVKPGYLVWEESEQVFCQANVHAPELRGALEAFLGLAVEPLRLVVEYDDTEEGQDRGRLFYSDHQTAQGVLDFLSRHGIWCLGDGFIGMGVAVLEPFREVFVDAHGELLVWWEPGSDDLDRFLDSLGLARHTEDALAFVSAHPHFHLAHELTGSLKGRIGELQDEWGFYEYQEDDVDEDDVGEDEP